jgi:glucose-6-phosphate isomerase
VDFVLPLTTHTGMAQQHLNLVANCLAQSRTLMIGRSLKDTKDDLLQRGLDKTKVENLAPHLVMPGNRPSSVITMESLNPTTLGALLALYEHRTFCSARLWKINPFDQWGVELGKEISVDISQKLQEKDNRNTMDDATERLIRRWKNAQN